MAPTPNQALKYGFGDHNGILGALDHEGRIYITTPASIPTSMSDLTLLSDPDSPPIAHLALAGNDRVAVTFVQAPNARLAHIVEFLTFEHFKAWHTDPASESHAPVKHHMVPGGVRQLIANATTFAALMSSGEVYTWGDARHRSLGRGNGSEDVTSADEAGLVEALGGIKVVRIASGGWMTAALSEEGAVYLWGIGMPGKTDLIRGLQDLRSAEVKLLDVLDAEEGEPLDFCDVAVGDGHVVLLAENGRVFAAGENANGQLGLGKGRRFVSEWEEVHIDGRPRCIAVHCGPKSSVVKAT